MNCYANFVQTWSCDVYYYSLFTHNVFVYEFVGLISYLNFYLMYENKDFQILPFQLF